MSEISVIRFSRLNSYRLRKVCGDRLGTKRGKGKASERTADRLEAIRGLFEHRLCTSLTELF